MNNSLSLSKTVEMITKLAKEDCVFSINGKETKHPVQKSILIGASFFRKFVCSCCGWCEHIRPTLDYFPFELKRIDKKDIKKDLKQFTFNINNKEKHIIMYDQLDHNNNKCKYTCNNLCLIHSYKPFSCALEPIKIRVKGNNSYLSKAKFGRSWLIRDGHTAQCKFEKFDTNQFNNLDMPLLLKLEEIANYLEINTWLPEIIRYLKSIDLNQLPNSSILIGSNY